MRTRVLGNLWVACARQRDGNLRDERHERRLSRDAQQPAVPHSSADEAPHDVAAPDVGGQHAVGDEVGDRAGMVAHHLQPRLGRLVCTRVVQACELHGERQRGAARSWEACLRCALDDWEDEVCLVVVGHALQDLRHALEAHARVDVPVRQGGEHAVRPPVALHEHQVVELDEAAVVLQRRALRAALGVEVEVQLAAGAAGAGWPRSPEVILLAHALDALHRHADHVAPQLERLRVLLEHAHPHAIRGQAKLDGGQLPGPPARGGASEPRPRDARVAAA